MRTILSGSDVFSLITGFELGNAKIASDSGDPYRSKPVVQIYEHIHNFRQSKMIHERELNSATFNSNLKYSRIAI